MARERRRGDRTNDAETGIDRREQTGEAGGVPLQLDRWLPYRLFRVSVRVANLLEDYYGPRFGLSRPAWRVLSVIGHTPGLSAGQIARAAGLDAFSVSRAITQLRDLGFAERGAARRDRRFAAVTLTDAGREAFLELSALADRIEKTLLTAIPADQRAMFDAILTALDDVSAALEARGCQSLTDTDGSRDKS